MKKICFLATCIALISTTALAAPQTDIKKGETSVDIGVISLKEHFFDETYPLKSNIDVGITTGVSDRYALQYKYHGLTSGEDSFKAHEDVKTQELNVLYKLNKNTDVFVGVNKFSGYDVSPGYLSGKILFETKTRVQYGITSKIPLGKSVEAWGTVAAGSDLLSCELGVSKALSKNTDLNLYYRYTENNDILFAHVIPFDFESNGFGLGVTMKF